MNGDDIDQGIDLGQFDPGFIRDGFGIQGEQPDRGSAQDLGPDDLFVQEIDMEDVGQTGGTGGGGGGITVTDGSSTVIDVTTLHFDGALFTVSDEGTGTAGITLKTTDCG